MTQQTIESTTQKFLDIHDITDDVLVLKDGSTSVVITLNAMNFGLLAEPEQDAIMYAYAGLLNSINYPIQIVIRSQTKDVTSYLNLLKEEQANETSDLKRSWIERYRVFVADLIKERNVLDKKFYVVISANALEMGMLPASSILPGTSNIDLSTIERSVILDKAKEILEPRRDHLLGQFARIGLYGRQLTTQELIQLFYLSYNPEAAEGQQITDTQSYTTPLVQASVQGGIMDSSNQNTNMGATPGAMPTTEPPATPPMPAAMPNPVEPMATPAANPTPVMPGTPTPMATPSATPSIKPATPAAMPTTPSSEPAIPSITKPADTSTPSAPPMPSATPSPMPGTPAATPMATPGTGMPAKDATDKTVDPLIQNEIDSTLKELGSMGASVPPATPPMPSATPSPMPGTPAASTPSMTTPTPTPAANADTGKDVDAMPPLPEI